MLINPKIYQTAKIMFYTKGFSQNTHMHTIFPAKSTLETMACIIMLKIQMQIKIKML
jgi:hypothetical protein